VISLIAFGLFFFGNNLAGNLAGYELAVLLVLGFVLMAVEIFIVPGTLIAGLVGGVMILAALVLAMVDRVDFTEALDKAPGALGIGEIVVTPLLNVLLAMVGAMVAMFFLLRYLPKTPGMRWMVLKGAVPGGGSLDMELSDDQAGSGKATARSLLGTTGEAITDLRPAGKGRFGDRLLDISADGEFIEKGTTLKVVRHEGSLVVVEAAG
jgi:membrane-bound serine protease (ClpP class)